MSIRYQLFTVVHVTAIIIADVDYHDNDDIGRDDTYRRYVKPERLLSSRQFYVSNLTCPARTDLPLAKLFGQNYNVTGKWKKRV